MKSFKIFSVAAVLSLFLFCANTAQAYDTAYYKDPKIGIFKITLDQSELKNHPIKSIVPVYDPAVLSEVYTFDSRSEKRDDVEIDSGEKSREALRKKIGEIEKIKYEMESEKSKLSEENRFLEKYKERVKSGQMKATEEDMKELEKKIEANRKKVKELDEKIRPMSEETEKLYNEMYSYGRHNLNKKDLNKEIKFYVIGRFFKSGPASLNLVNAATGDTVETLSLTLIDREDKSDAKILKHWFEIQKNYYGKLKISQASGVFNYIAGQSERRFAGSTAEVKVSGRTSRDNFNGRQDLYSMASGMLAIQEALQLDRMTGESLREDYKYVRTDTLHGPAIKSHPFEIMLAGKKPKTYPLDSLVPSDFYYLHFSNIRDQIELSELMDKWGSNFLHLMQVSSTDSRMKEKYLDQLCLKVSDLTKLFGDKVIDDMALCGSDPFLEDGTDLSVIFSIKNKTVFDLNASRYFADAKIAYKDLKDELIDAKKFKIRAVYTPNGVVSSYSCYINDFLIYSNSKTAILKIIDTFENPKKSMANADDFLYMRTVYETGAENENAFLYLSDSHIRKLVGPEWKIERQRRLNCTASLRIINNAITLYYMDKKNDRPAIETLVSKGYLDPNYIFCPDGGEYFIDATSLEPYCSKHRRLRFVTPIIEMIPEFVSQSELEQYRRFVTEYNNYWTKFFDPVGIRIKNGPKAISLETCILPLVENSFYTALSAASGGMGVKFYAPKVPGTILSVRAKINLKDQQNMRFFDEMLSATSFTTDRFLKFMGNNVSFNLLDSDIRFTLDPFMSRVMMFSPRDSWVVYASFLLSALNHPVYVMFDVTDMKEAETFLTELFRFIEEENAKRARGFVETDFCVYKVRPVENGPAIYSINYRLAVIGLNLHVMLHNNKLILATKRSILTDILSNTENSGATSETNFELEVNSANFDQISRTYSIVWAEKMRNACHSNLWPIYALNKFRNIPIEAIKDASLSVNGYVPYCPAGGDYVYDKSKDLISCTLHGNVHDQKQPLLLDENNELVKFFKSIRKVKAALQFTVHGIMTKVTIERE